MKVDTRKVVIAFLLIVFAFSILTLVYWDFVRDTIVVPIYYLLWVIGLILRSIPQGAYLAVLLLICLGIGLNTLGGVRGRRADGNPGVGIPQGETRYRHWRVLCANISASHFSQNFFASEARKLILSILAYEQGVGYFEAEALVISGDLEVPETIRDLIEKKEIQHSKPPTTRLKNLLRRLRLLEPDAQIDPQLNALLAEIVGFIEQHTEKAYDGHQSDF